MLNDTTPFPVPRGSKRVRDENGRLVHPSPCTIPWWLAEAVYEEYKAKYGNTQSLERIAERGGFHREEILWLLGEAGVRKQESDKGQ